MFQVNVIALDKYFQTVHPIFEGGKYIWRNFKKTLKNRVFLYLCLKLYKRAKTSPQGTFSQIKNFSPYSSLKVLTYIYSAPIF